MLEKLCGRRVLVTGGSGFIGGQLVARLAKECQSNVRVLVRRFGSAARISRFPVELVQGDISSPEDIDRAVTGCDLVFHCAYGKDGDDRARRHATVAGAENVLAASLRHNVSRIVYASTFSVYGELTTSHLDETAPRRITGDTYGDSKVEAEEVAFRYWRQHRVPVSIVQPTIVYGPFGFSFTVNPLQQLRTGRLPLVNGGSGRCNAVYVDDVVTAMLLAAVRDEAVGEAFLVSGPQPVTWRDFYGSYEHMLGVSATVSMTPDEALAHYYASQPGSTSLVGEALRLLGDRHVRERLASTREGAWIASGLRAALPRRVRQTLTARVKAAARETPAGGPHEPPAKIHPVRPARIRLFAAPTAVQIGKASRLLGYEPRFDLQAGMALTREWARWADLVA